ncbi:PRTRC system protein D [Acidiferrobacter sp.]|uniref:PRTRC system protein D n=1 Tax=Acidiferrobacter sp. TaxID=1872107 RepID=UPI0026296C5A|nr:PRTRC system protein D [Acidiferrobacter sp.]
MKTIRAVDVGYGNIKFVVSRSENEIGCKMFPAIAPVAANLDLATGLDMSRDTVRVDVNGVLYEVGPQARLALRGQHIRILHGDFSRTAEYMALTRGALAYMHVPEISLLVVGLPVSLMHSRAQSLARELQGFHAVGDGHGVHVHHVWVLAQPLGSLLSYAMGTASYQGLAEQVNLVIDVGFGTVDWLTSIGIQAMPERTGSFSGGTHAILQSMARGLSETLQVDYADISAIDRALGRGRLVVGGREVDLAPHWRRAQARIQEAVNAIANGVGNALDVNNIVLTGGGAKFYESAIRKHFPTPRLILAQDPIFANVRGFQIAGENHTGIAT